MQTESAPPMAATSVKIIAFHRFDHNGRRIIDREVWADGEHRGTWLFDGSTRFLNLHRLNGDWAKIQVPHHYSATGLLLLSTQKAIEQGLLPSPTEQRAQDAAATARRDAEHEASRRFAVTIKHLALIQEAIIEAIDTLEVIDSGEGSADALIAKLYRAKAAALGIEPDMAEGGAA